MSINDIKVVEAEEPATIETIYILVKSMQKEIKELRTDVDKLIENGR